jgi:hypothetical protein
MAPQVAELVLAVYRRIRGERALREEPTSRNVVVLDRRRKTSAVQELWFLLGPHSGGPRRAPSKRAPRWLKDRGPSASGLRHSNASSSASPDASPRGRRSGPAAAAPQSQRHDKRAPGVRFDADPSVVSEAARRLFERVYVRDKV